MVALQFSRSVAETESLEGEKGASRQPGSAVWDGKTNHPFRLVGVCPFDAGSLSELGEINKRGKDLSVRELTRKSLLAEMYCWLTIKSSFVGCWAWQ